MPAFYLPPPIPIVAAFFQAASTPKPSDPPAMKGLDPADHPTWQPETAVNFDQGRWHTHVVSNEAVMTITKKDDAGNQRIINSTLVNGKRQVSHILDMAVGSPRISLTMSTLTDDQKLKYKDLIADAQQSIDVALAHKNKAVPAFDAKDEESDSWIIHGLKGGDGHTSSNKRGEGHTSSNEVASPKSVPSSGVTSSSSVTGKWEIQQTVDRMSDAVSSVAVTRVQADPVGMLEVRVACSNDIGATLYIRSVGNGTGFKHTMVEGGISAQTTYAGFGQYSTSGTVSPPKSCVKASVRLDGGNVKEWPPSDCDDEGYVRLLFLGNLSKAAQEGLLGVFAKFGPGNYPNDLNGGHRAGLYSMGDLLNSSFLCLQLPFNNGQVSVAQINLDDPAFKSYTGKCVASYVAEKAAASKAAADAKAEADAKAAEERLLSHYDFYSGTPESVIAALPSYLKTAATVRNLQADDYAKEMAALGDTVRFCVDNASSASSRASRSRPPSGSIAEKVWLQCNGNFIDLTDKVLATHGPHLLARMLLEPTRMRLEVRFADNPIAHTFVGANIVFPKK
ncbi:MAG: hypothetical protein WDN23_17190 [Edaphobacter sp.]